MQALSRDPFQLPTRAENEYALSQISRNQQLLQDIDAEIRRLEQAKLQRRHEIAVYQSLLAPVRRLTYDALERLFNAYVHENHGDPWVLAHVCQKWRSAALVTPSLWTAVHLVLDPSPASPLLKRRVDGKECCTNLNQLELALRRASNNLIGVTIASPPTIPLVVRAHIPAMLHLVSQRMNRWNSLEVQGAISHLPGLNSSSLDSLKSLTLHSRDTSLLPLINQTATHLRSLTTSQLGLEEFESAVWLSTVQQLDVTIPVDASLSPQTPVLRRILAKTEMLQSLTLDFHQMQPEVTPLATLDNLRMLELYDIPSLLPFTCPNLTHLKISVCKRRPIVSTAPLPTPSKPIHLQHLTHLVFQHPNIAALSAIVAPQLIELVISPQVRIITPQYNDTSLRAIWNEKRKVENGVLSPTVFKLEDIHVSSEAILEILRFMPELKELGIRWVRTDHTAVIQGLAGMGPSKSNRAANMVPLVAPKLNSFWLHDSSTLRSTDTGSMQRSLENVVRKRKEAGHPLKSVVCRWPQGSDMEEFRI